MTTTPKTFPYTDWIAQKQLAEMERKAMQVANFWKHQQYRKMENLGCLQPLED